MTDSQGGITDQASPTPLSLLPTTELLPEDAVGWCADGVCHVPAPKVPAQKAE